MKQSTKRLMSTILAFVFVVSAVGVFASLIRPAYQELNKRRGELAEREDFVASQEKVVEQVKKLLTTLAEGGEQYATVSYALPLTMDVVGSIAQLNGLITANNLAPQSFAVNLATKTGEDQRRERRPARTTLAVSPVGVLALKVRVIGGYDDFKRFLRQAETNIRIMDVREVEVQTVGKANQDLFVYDLSVDAYYQTKS